MAKCEVCGNDYDKAFEITKDGTSHVFDSFECAIHALAPRCDGCGVPVIGHGLEAQDLLFCCNACAEGNNIATLRDRA